MTRSPGLAGDVLHTTGMEHSPTSATGTGWEPTPWHATQRAAWGGAQRARQRHLMPGRERPLTRGDFALLLGVAIVIACWIDVAIAAPRLALVATRWP